MFKVDTNQRTEESRIIKIEYEYFGLTDISDAMLDAAPLLTVRAKREESCDQNYDQFLSTAPKLKQEGSDDVLVRGITFVENFKDLKIAPERILPCYALEKGDFRETGHEEETRKHFSLARMIFANGTASGKVVKTINTNAVGHAKTSTRSTGVTEDGVSLSFEISALVYKKHDNISMRYELENKTKEDIFVVIGEELIPGYNLETRQLTANLHKFIVGYDFFAMPKLQRIRPGDTAKGTATLPLEFLNDHFRDGAWDLSLSLGYLNANDMRELSSPPLSGSPAQFDKRQKVIEAHPIRLLLAN